MKPFRSYGIAPPGLRLPDATHVGAVHLQVSDINRSRDYYQEVLGLHVLSEVDGVTALGDHHDEQPLLTLRTRPGTARARRGAFGLYHFALLLPDRAALGRFASHLSALGIRAGTADHLVSEAFYLWDPDNLGIEVYADRPREAWQHRNGELAMTTDPLDVASVVAAGGGRAWEGAPAGTTMGHVHLHVGRLDEAEAFYHRAVGFDKTVWSYPGALFLGAGGYHHHLGTNVWSPGPTAAANEARLLEWEIVVPGDDNLRVAGHNIRDAGFTLEESNDAVRCADPWGTRLVLRARN